MKRGRLAVRLLLLGIAQLAVLGGAAIALEWMSHSWSPPPDVHGILVEQGAERVEPLLDRPGELRRVLEDLSRRDNAELTVYDAHRRVIASTVDPPIVPRHDHFGGPHPDRPERLRPPHDHHGPPPGPPDLVSVPLRSGGVLVAKFSPPLPPYAILVITLVIGLVLIGAGALTTARWIVRPLERLSKTADAIGRGELDARTNLRRDDELGDVAKAVDAMAERVQLLLAQERELLANVAHELRTPLARIHVAMDLAAEGDGDRARASVVDIATDLAELEALVDDVLMALRLESAPRSGLPLTTLEQTPANKLVESAAEKLRVRHPNRPLVLDVQQDLEPVIVDRVLMRRAIDNLLENAHKYTPDPALPITLRARNGSAGVEIAIVDQGVGIAPEDLDRVFRPFFRVERSRTRSAGGTGLGLTLAKRIIEAHGGTICIESEGRGGSTARLVIPYGLADG